MSDEDPLVVEGRNDVDDALAWAGSRIAALARGRVLDVGCGDGRFLPPDGVGVDLDAARLREARARSSRLVRGDARTLPFRDATFDTAFANRMLNASGDLDAVLAEIRRVLRADGRLVVLTLARRAPSPLRAIHDEAREALGLRSARGERLDDENGEERLRRHFSRVERERFGRRWRFADPSEALDHYARRYLHREHRDRAAAAALFARVREGVRAFRGELADDESATLFIASG